MFFNQGICESLDTFNQRTCECKRIVKQRICETYHHQDRQVGRPSPQVVWQPAGSSCMLICHMVLADAMGAHGWIAQGAATNKNQAVGLHGAKRGPNS